MKNTELKFQRIIVGSDIRALILGYATNTPVFVVNFKKSKVCDFYHTPFCVSQYCSKFGVEFVINSSAKKILYPKISIETDLSCLLGLGGLIFTEFTQCKIVDDNKIMLFGRKNIHVVEFEKCIIVDPKFELSFMDAEKTDEQKKYIVYDFFYFQNRMENHYRKYPNFESWRIRDDYTSTKESIAVFVKELSSKEELGQYGMDATKMAARRTDDVIYKEMFQLTNGTPHEYYAREVDIVGKDLLYKDTEFISFVYDSDEEIMEKVNGK